MRKETQKKTDIGLFRHSCKVLAVAVLAAGLLLCLAGCPQQTEPADPTTAISTLPSLPSVPAETAEPSGTSAPEGTTAAEGTTAPDETTVLPPDPTAPRETTTGGTSVGEFVYPAG